MSKFKEMLETLKNEWAIRGKRKTKNKPTSRKETLRTALLIALLLLALLGGLLVFVAQEDSVQRPPADLVMDSVIGTWSGTAVLPGGRQQTYVLTLRQDGASIMGEAYSADNVGSASVYLVGSYQNGWLLAEESGGTIEGWSGVCYWAIELQTTGDSSSPHMTGQFHRIEREGYSCHGSGTIELTRQ